VLKDATCSTPNVANVIPIMDIINDTLTTATNDQNISLAIRTAAGLAKKTLNRYYSRTDESETYRIAMSMSFSFMLPLILTDFAQVLHPQYKLQYFKTAKWEEDWIDTAKAIFHTQYELYYYCRDTDMSKHRDDLELVCDRIPLFFVS
jgi:hypothetical protein